MNKRKFSHNDRMHVYIKYHGCCAICGKHLRPDGQSMTLDHIIPLSRGGANGTQNLQLACRACNQYKDNNLPIEFTKRLWKAFWRSVVLDIRFYSGLISK